LADSGKRGQYSLEVPPRQERLFNPMVPGKGER